MDFQDTAPAIDRSSSKYALQTQVHSSEKLPLNQGVNSQDWLILAFCLGQISAQLAGLAWKLKGGRHEH